MSEKPPNQKPELADFWDHRFRNGSTPWDAGEAPLALREFAERLEAGQFADHGRQRARLGQRTRVLVPGCGSAWDAAFLASRGWETTALDFSAAAVAAARATLGDAWQGSLLCGDFFAFAPESTFDLIYERAFLCALPRHLWSDYARRMAELLRPGGLLAGFFFFSDEVRGPPFGIVPQQLHGLLEAAFSCLEDLAVPESLPIFAGREHWQVWQRR